MSWHSKLTPYDAELCRMVESLTGVETEPRLGGDDEYFIVVDYSAHPQPDWISAVLDAIQGRVGERFIEMNNDPENSFCIVHIRFDKERTLFPMKRQE